MAASRGLRCALKPDPPATKIAAVNISAHHAVAQCPGASRVPSDSTGAFGSQGARATTMKRPVAQATAAEYIVAMTAVRRVMGPQGTPTRGGRLHAGVAGASDPASNSSVSLLGGGGGERSDAAPFGALRRSGTLLSFPAPDGLGRGPGHLASRQPHFLRDDRRCFRGQRDFFPGGLAGRSALRFEAEQRSWQHHPFVAVAIKHDLPTHCFGEPSRTRPRERVVSMNVSNAASALR